ncbi:7414_t:CDS:2 [Entrophospora sp. SA101]|nr:7414_t:CDS:2 [Entrophospora sp. SA101]
MSNNSTQNQQSSHSGTVDTYGASQRVGGGTTFHGSSGTYSGTSHTEG